MRELGLLQDRTRTGQEAGVSSEAAAAELERGERQKDEPLCEALGAPLQEAGVSSEATAAELERGDYLPKVAAWQFHDRGR